MLSTQDTKAWYSEQAGARSASIDELDQWAERMLTADRLEQMLEP